MAKVRSRSKLSIRIKKRTGKRREAKLGAGMAEGARKKIKSRKGRVDRAIKRAGG